MKKFYPIILFAISALYTQSSRAQVAGELWGMTSQGGRDGLGVMFKTAPDGTGQAVQKDFTTLYPGGSPFYTKLTPANGKLYGLTSGGAFGAGVLFEFDPLTGNYTRKLDFNNSTGGIPYGSLTLASNGRFYGTTFQGGANGQGVLFEYDPATGTYVNRFDFNGPSTGNNPNGDVIQATNGKLYGMTTFGGANGFGVLFEYDLSTSTFNKKFDFDGTNGSVPIGNLTQAADGKLYGMTSSGGTNGQGVLFEYDLSVDAYTKVLDFDGANGANPYGSLTLASNGKLYGMTQQGGANAQGVLFEFDPSSSNYATLMDFNFVLSGAYPLGDLMQASNGKLYGMTSGGGTSNNGVLFEFDLSTATYTKGLDFNNTNGAYPRGALTQASNGKLYAMTATGGSNYQGVLFEYDPSTAGYVKKLDFNQSSDGTNPHDSFMQAPDGKLYGTTSTGGVNGYGVIFQYDPSSGNYTKKVDFDYSTNGATPYGRLTLATNGKAYGMTSSGGINGVGVIFEYSPSSGTFTKKLDLAYPTGGSPWGSLTQASNGKLYGMTSSGGVNSGGVIFEYNPLTNSYSDLFDFGGVNGTNPYGNLTQASNGKLYGMTAFGGANNVGVLFEYDPATSTYAKELDFDSSNGMFPWGNSLIQAFNGRLYGVTSAGGYNFGGVLFEYDPTTAAYTKLLDFENGFTGGNPQGSLTQGVNGKLYGMTNSGGAFSQGVLFEYDLSTATYNKTSDFNAANGQYPYGQLLVLRNAQTITFAALASKTTSDAPFALSATASSGLAVTYTSSDPTVASISGNTVTILKAGTTIITASQAGDQLYLAAPAVQQPLTINSGTLAPVYAISPTDGAVNLNINLAVTSKELKGAKTYTINISPDNTFTTGVVTKSGDRTQYFTGLSYNTKYYVRVKTNKSPDYGKVTTFTTAPSEFFAYVTSPANGAVNTGVDLKVISNSVIGATTYYIDISPDRTFATHVITKSGDRSLLFTGLSYRTTYYARVKTNLSSVYGKTTSFTTARTAGGVHEDDPHHFGPCNADAFPNPFHDRITVQVQSDEDEAVFIQLFDVRGKETVQQAGVTNSLIEIKTGDLSTGMYILKVATSKGIKVTKVIRE